jgi:hypothetical protein
LRFAYQTLAQANRRKKVGAFVFQARDPLPSLVPQGEEWNQCISNRVFKGKVIKLVIERLVCTVTLAEGQSLIIDYQVLVCLFALCACLPGWLFGCLAVWLFGCLAVWLFGCLAVWLLG